MVYSSCVCLYGCQAAQALFDGAGVEEIRTMVPELNDKSPDQLKDK